MLSNAEILHCLKTTQANTAKALAECEPGTEEYMRMVHGFDQLVYTIARLEDQNEAHGDCYTNTPSPVEPAGHPDPVGEPGEPGEPGIPGDDEGDTEGPDNQPTPREPIVPEDLRAELSDAKKKGVVISELIESLGAKNFSALKDDQDKLWALKEKLDKALKELGV